jgi:hypothetical protein
VIPFIPTTHSVARTVKWIHKKQITPMLFHVSHLFKPTTTDMVEKMKSLVSIMKNPWNQWLYSLEPIPGVHKQPDNDMIDDDKKYYFVHLDVTLDSNHSVPNNFTHEERCEMLAIQCYELAKQLSCQLVLWPNEFNLNPLLEQLLHQTGIEFIKMKELDSPESKLMEMVSSDSSILDQELHTLDNFDQIEVMDEVMENLGGFYFDPTISVFEILDCYPVDSENMSSSDETMDQNSSDEYWSDGQLDSEMDENEF